MKKKTKRRVILGVAAVCVIAMVSGVLLYANSFRNYELIYPNVTCDGVPLAGMTYEEAESTIAGIIDQKQYQVTVRLPETDPFTVIPEQTVTEQEPGTALREVWNCGREDSSFFGPMLSYLGAGRGRRDVQIRYAFSYDPDSVKSQIDSLKTMVTVEPTDCTGSVDPDAHTATVSLGAKGRTIDADAAAAQVCRALDSGNDKVELSFEEIPLEEGQVETLLSELADEGYVEVREPDVTYDEATQTSVLDMGMPGYALDADALEEQVFRASDAGEETVTVTLQETDPQEYDLDGFYQWLKRDPEGIYYADGELYGGTPGYDFDLAAAEKAQEEAEYGDQVEIPLTVTDPIVPIDYARTVLFRDQLGRADTYHTGAYARTNNLILSCEAIDGTILNPGEEFSFNDVVGERTASKGYMSALVYLSTGNESQLGGGICQTASTLYMAALKSGMEITERAEHMYTVSYCPLGLDATIYWGYSDLRFINTSCMPVRINASVSGGQVHMSISGTNFTGHYIELSSERVSSSPIGYRAYRTIYNPDGTEYYTEDLGVSYYSSH